VAAIRMPKFMLKIQCTTRNESVRRFAPRLLYNELIMVTSLRKVLGFALLGIMLASAVPAFATPQTGKKGSKKGGKKGKGKAGKKGGGNGKSL
jgi:hypothetical protein